MKPLRDRINSETYYIGINFNVFTPRVQHSGSVRLSDYPIQFFLYMSLISHTCYTPRYHASFVHINAVFVKLRINCIKIVTTLNLESIYLWWGCCKEHTFNIFKLIFILKCLFRVLANNLHSLVSPVLRNLISMCPCDFCSILHFRY